MSSKIRTGVTIFGNAVCIHYGTPNRNSLKLTPLSSFYKLITCGDMYSTFSNKEVEIYTLKTKKHEIMMEIFLEKGNKFLESKIIVKMCLLKKF